MPPDDSGDPASTTSSLDGSTAPEPGLDRSLIRFFDRSEDAVLVTDRDGTVRYVNAAFEEQLGVAGAGAVGRPARRLGPARRAREAFRRMAEAAIEGRVYRGVATVERPDGRKVRLSNTVTPLQDDEGRTTHVVVTSRPAEPSQASLEARGYDPVTGLPFRRVLEEQARPMLARSRREQTTVALMLLDLNGLDRINAAFGRPGGDAVLRATADRLQIALRESDLVGRLEDDTLAAVLQDVTEVESLARVARRVSRAASEPVDHAGETIPVQVTMGIAVYPRDASSLTELFEGAGAALLRAIAGAADFEFFQGELSVVARDRLKLEDDLDRASDADEFVLHFQPIVATATGRLVGAEALTRGSVIGVEALARWPHQERGMVLPAEFIPLAESSGRILALDRWVVATAIREAARWWNDGWPGWISVNLSMRSIRDPGLADYIDRTMRRQEVDPERLVLEVTESAAVRDPDATIELLTGLKDAGVKIAIDDFGVGYSSLSYLKSFPVDILKLDQSFVRDIGRDEKDEHLIEAIVGLAHRIGAQIVAEGVEQPAQMEWLRSVGCDLVQGYLLGRPGPAHQIRPGS